MKKNRKLTTARPKPKLREVDVINAEYAEQCKLFGDYLIKAILFNPQVLKLQETLRDLSEELTLATEIAGKKAP